MIIKCPNCRSENVTRISADSDEFICDDCGHDFGEDEFDDAFGDKLVYNKGGEEESE